jgi:hypothetical protein
MKKMAMAKVLSRFEPSRGVGVGVALLEHLFRHPSVI